MSDGLYEIEGLDDPSQPKRYPLLNFWGQSYGSVDPSLIGSANAGPIVNTKGINPATSYSNGRLRAANNDYLNWALELAKQNPKTLQSLFPINMGDDANIYDYNAAYQSGLGTSGGHLPDVGKKPNHPTYSDESVYAFGGDPRAGHWIEPVAGENAKSNDWRYNNPSRGLYYAQEDAAYQPDTRNLQQKALDNKVAGVKNTVPTYLMSLLGRY